MPILEYQCKECERQFEAIVLGSQQPMSFLPWHEARTVVVGVCRRR